jgi:hypothetical protein
VRDYSFVTERVEYNLPAPNANFTDAWIYISTVTGSSTPAAAPFIQ